MHAYIRLISSRVSSEYRLTVIYTVSDPSHIADLNNQIVMFTQDRVATQSLCSHRVDKCIRGCPIPCDRFTQVQLILRKAGRLPIEMSLHLDATEEGGPADQSTKVNILIHSGEEGRTADSCPTWTSLRTSLTGKVAEPSTKVNT